VSLLVFPPFFRYQITFCTTDVNQTSEKSERRGPKKYWHLDTDLQFVLDTIQLVPGAKRRSFRNRKTARHLPPNPRNHRLTPPVGREFRSSRIGSKARSHSIAMAKSPEAFGCTRRTLPRAVRRTPGSGLGPAPTASSTVEPSGIRKALDNRMPLRLMFSDRAYISLLASLTETGKCK